MPTENSSEVEKGETGDRLDQPVSQDQKTHKHKTPYKPAIIVTVLVFLATLVYLLFNPSSKPYIYPGTFTPKSEVKFEKFKSEQDFKQYIQESQSQETNSFMRTTPAFSEAVSMDMGLMGLEGASGGAPDIKRVSETNVQVKGIDEPDIVKTDGTTLYFSDSFTNTFPVILEAPQEQTSVSSYPRYEQETKVINIFPPADLEEIGDIEKQGNLLLYKDILMVFTNEDVFGYDVSNPESPSKKWDLGFDRNHYIVTSRLYDDDLYVIAKTNINAVRPCPMPLLSGTQIACNDIYHPTKSTNVDSTYTAMLIDPKDGKVKKRVSFVGSSSKSVVYLSENSIYTTYTYNEDLTGFIYSFYTEKGSDLISEEALEKIRKLQTYDISSQSKLTELGLIIQNYYMTLDEDEKRRVENEMQNRMEDYADEHVRDIQKTAIVKIDISDFSVKATGEVPGTPLNQFSLDEYNENLRVATTISGSFWNARTDSANDVYVLDKNLDTQGEVQNMGLTEQIYSARFIGDKGYLVTFRRIDPFYVLDLSDPKNPQLKGELKIPGYSSYLHPIDDVRILGIGEEQGNVKISLFNVSDAQDPKEASKYILDDYWSEVNSNHRAFMMDKKFGVFFLPGRTDGYIFSYDNDELSLKKVVSDVKAKRAVYVNDYLYIVGSESIKILNENDWTEVNSMTF